MVSIFEKFKFNLAILGVGGFFALAVYTALNAVALEPTFNHNIFAVIMMVPFLSIIITIILKSLYGDIIITRAFRFWNATSGILSLILIEAHAVLGFGEPTSHSLTPFIPAYIFALCVIATTLVSDYLKSQKVFIVVGVIIGLLIFHLPFLHVRAVTPYAICTVTIFAMIAGFFATLKYRKAFQLFLLFIALRLGVLYFQLLEDSSAHGVGLIISSAFILTTVFFWNKYRLRIADWAEKTFLTST